MQIHSIQDRSIVRSRTINPSEIAFQECISPDCAATYSVSEPLTACQTCGGLLDVKYNWDRAEVPQSLKEFEGRWLERRNPLNYSGVWRFRNLFPFAPDDSVITIGEGQTQLLSSESVANYVGMNAGNLALQYEGLNPSGSFKDNGMTAAATHARMVGASFVACASTGNTSASLAIFASATGLFHVVVFVGSGKIAFGKLSQALDYGAITMQIMGDFDDALMRVREVCEQMNIYLCNSVNPFRLEGQKSIMYRVLEARNWEPPDWIVVPGGNLGNSSAFGKAFQELKDLGLIDRIPRIAIINAQGADTLYRLVEQEGLRWNDGRPSQDSIKSFYETMNAENRRANTLASAIEINRPVNLEKALRTLDLSNGLVREVDDEAILDAKAQVGAGGFGCEPASAASVAGARLLLHEGVIAPSDHVVCILTGHQLKDPDATVNYHTAENKRSFSNQPIPVANDTTEIIRLLEQYR